MNPSLLLPLAVGLAVVVQAGVNRQVAAQWGLAGAAVVNSIVVLVIALLVFAAVKLRPESVPEILRVPEQGGTVAPWRVWIPGALGLLIVIGLPWAFSELGALQVILSVLVAQLFASLLWDLWVEGIPAHPLRVTGAVVALAGAVLASWKR